MTLAIERPNPHARSVVPILSGLVAGLAFVYRFTSFSGFENDHFVHLARARQLLLGDLPVRDFVDPGMPLFYAASAAAQVVLGDSLFSEAMLTIGLVATTAALTFYSAWRLSGSVVAALAVALLQVLIRPRLYSYPKVFIYAVAIPVLWAYARTPSLARLAMVAAWTAVAFLWRHDHGGYVAAAALTLIVASCGRTGRLVAARNSLVFGLFVVVLLSPYLVFIQRQQPLNEYVASAIRFTREENRHTRLERWPRPNLRVSGPLLALAPSPVPERPDIHVRWTRGLPPAEVATLERRYRLEKIAELSPFLLAYRLHDISWSNVAALVGDRRVETTDGIIRPLGLVVPSRSLVAKELLRRVPILRLRSPWLAEMFAPSNAEAWLFYLYLAVPMLSLIVLIRASKWSAPATPAIVISLAVMLALMNPGMLRELLRARLPDVSVPAAVLGAWLIVRARGPTARALTALTLAITAGALVTVGGVREAVVESGVLWGPPGVISRASEVAQQLTAWPWEQQWPSGRLPPVVRYVHDCTNPGDRLLVTWFAPEYYVFARRGFAAGQATFLPGYYTSPDDQAQAVRRLEAQSVPIALIDRARHASFRSEFPGIERYVSARFVPVGEFDAGEGHRVMILADRERAPHGRYAPYGWPCFR